MDKLLSRLRDLLDTWLRHVEGSVPFPVESEYRREGSTLDNDTEYASAKSEGYVSDDNEDDATTATIDESAKSPASLDRDSESSRAVEKDSTTGVDDDYVVVPGTDDEALDD